MNDKKKAPARPPNEARVKPKAITQRKVSTAKPAPRPVQHRTMPSPTKR
jgi:hypothetical protein